MAVKLPIYMDNHATTPVDPRVVEAMLPYFTEKFGNAASRNHSFGWAGEEAVENARAQVASLIGATPKEIIFTSGATESDNLMIKGVAEMYREKGNHIITQAIEHKAVLDTCKRLEKYGYEVTYLPVQRDGRVDPEDVRKAITPKTILITIMYANNEIGDHQPDARKSARLPRNTASSSPSMVCRRSARFPWTCRRTTSTCWPSPGTRFTGRRVLARSTFAAATPACSSRPSSMAAATSAACAPARSTSPASSVWVRLARSPSKRWRRKVSVCAGSGTASRTGLEAKLDEVFINGSMEHRLPNNLNMSFAYVEGESLLMGINDIAVSSGSACTSATLEPSYVLKALGVGEDLAHTSIRFGLGRFNTPEEVDYVIDKMVQVVTKLRELSPLYEMAKEGIDISKMKWQTA